MLEEMAGIECKEPNLKINLNVFHGYLKNPVHYYIIGYPVSIHDLPSISKMTVWKHSWVKIHLILSGIFTVHLDVRGFSNP